MFKVYHPDFVFSPPTNNYQQTTEIIYDFYHRGVLGFNSPLNVLEEHL
jgi:hypothetical protein